MSDTYNEIKTKKYIQKAKLVHGDKFNYGLVNYKNSKSKIKIKCNTCDKILEQEANSHLRGNGCKFCKNKKQTYTKEKFIKRAINKYGDLYDYKDSVYISFKKPIRIYCKKCKEYFFKSPKYHLNGRDCPVCAKNRFKKQFSSTTEIFIQKIEKRFPNKFILDKVEYVNHKTKIKIGCKYHGYFYITPNNLLSGKGCAKCGYERSRKASLKTTNYFIKKSKMIHGDKYKYDKSKYTRAKDLIIITCPEHGDFKQKAISHMIGKGCPRCNDSKGERKISLFLTKNNIKFIREYRLSNYKYKYDFYLPELNMLIEYDGEQHFKPMRFVENNNDRLKYIQRNDEIKNELARNNGYILLRIKYTDYDNVEQIVIKTIKRYFRYRYNNKFFKSFIALGKYLNLDKNITHNEVSEYTVKLNA